MTKQNCWEFQKCGRQPGGANVPELGICPASVEKRAAGLNDGKEGGRACWALTGTFCAGEVEGTYAAKLRNCCQCEFYIRVHKEEGDKFKGIADILRKVDRSWHPGSK